MVKTKKRSFLVAILPVAIFAGIAAVFFVMLTSPRDPSAIPSALVGKSLPELTLSALEGAERNGAPIPAMTTAAISDATRNKGRAIIVNVWASWCAPCRQEHPFLMALAARSDVMIVGLNYKDKNAQALKFLNNLGNPYEMIGVDPNGRASIDLGVYGIPETFIISPDGKILYKHVGPILSAPEQKTILNKIADITAK